MTIWGALSGKGVYVTIDETMKFLIHHGHQKAIDLQKECDEYKNNLYEDYKDWTQEEIEGEYDYWRQEKFSWMMDNLSWRPKFGEYTIYEPPHDILRDIYRTKDDTIYVVGKSTQYSFDSPKDLIKAGKELEEIQKHDFSDLEEIVGDKAINFGFCTDCACCS
jgi:hypothetical protein